MAILALVLSLISLLLGGFLLYQWWTLVRLRKVVTESEPTSPVSIPTDEAEDVGTIDHLHEEDEAESDSPTVEELEWASEQRDRRHRGR